MSLPGPLEIVVVILVALIVLGPERLGTTARQMGRYYRQFRDVTAGVQDEMREMFDEVTAEPVKPKSAELPSDVTLGDESAASGASVNEVNTDETVAGSAPPPTVNPVVIVDGDFPAAEEPAVVDSDVVRE